MILLAFLKNKTKPVYLFIFLKGKMTAGENRRLGEKEGKSSIHTNIDKQGIQHHQPSLTGPRYDPKKSKACIYW